eukprot:TRINITY_DN36644_c0_g1_i1.p1 TRINITY_DN36644_c0_g1~~TRINITY_DN36644_c0_g1_i1.p1  ORF type:complete len:724 (-),score=152.83 TRINITY_DN36644_c0_g1_i1:184-2355(-)
MARSQDIASEGDFLPVEELRSPSSSSRSSSSSSRSGWAAARHAAVSAAALVGVAGLAGFGGAVIVDRLSGQRSANAAERSAVSWTRFQRSALSSDRWSPVQVIRHDGEDAMRRLQTPEPPVTCNDASRWDQLQWAYLSTSEKNAWLMLGWNQTTWNDFHPLPSTTTLYPGGRRAGAEEDAAAGRRLQFDPYAAAAYRPPADQACFQELPVDRQDAVLTLGYTIESWHACKAPECEWPAEVPRPDAPCLDHFLYLERKYDKNGDWWSLSNGQRNALVNLGWDEYGTRWETKDKPPIYARPWNELLPREREAAVFLGYSKRVWHLCEDETPCIKRLQLLEARFGSYRWNMMPAAIRDRLEELGWNERSWLEGEEPAPLKLTWRQLPWSQQQSARLLGYSEDTWMRCPTAPCLDRFAYVKDKYAGVGWYDLKLAVQRAWLLLEHSPELWAQYGASNMRTQQVRWEELSLEQRRQAEFLGHSLGTWQGCNEQWVAPPTENRSEVPLSPTRVVRGRMTIQRPFTEISGNVYGAQVATLPTSFIETFEKAVARALFCGNPPLSEQVQTYVDVDGQPLCIVRSNYDMQKHRIKVVTVEEGSIIVDFYILANQTIDQPTAPQLYDALLKLIESDTSPLVKDPEFGRYAEVASLQEVRYSNLEYQERLAALEFEKLRASYTGNNACLLGMDARQSPKASACATSGAPRIDVRGVPWFVGAATWLLLLTLAPR